MDVTRTLYFATTFLGDPAGFWKRATPEHRPRLPQAIYPNGLRYDGELTGTAETSLAFSCLKEIEVGKEGMASHAHPSWNRTWDWLLEVASLRKALVEPAHAPPGGVGGTWGHLQAP